MSKRIFSTVKKLFQIVTTKTAMSFRKEEDLVNTNNNAKDQPIIKLNTTQRFLLQQNLKHLEFINFLETRYSEKALNQFPVEVLQSFQNIKMQAQNNTLNLLQSKVA